MRLIDADKLQKAIPAEEDNITGMGMTYDEMEAYNDGIDEQWKKIVNAPTIEPQRPKGEWILKKELVPLAWDCTPMDYDNYDEETHCELKGFYHCSNCDWKSGEFKGGNFCTNCGYDMRGEQDEID